MNARRRRWWATGGLGILCVAGCLFIPEARPAAPRAAAFEPFVWAADSQWAGLEARFQAARQAGCGGVRARRDAALLEFDALLAAVDARAPAVDDPALDDLERRVFELGPLSAACVDGPTTFEPRVTRLRTLVKRWSTRWPMDDRATRARLYRLLYGSRAALEEVLLQGADGGASAPRALAELVDAPSATPSVVVHGIRVHSGDILVSRGGAPTSALIARGNDFPGNFSHIGLVHVSEAGVASTIEAHIEVGVVVAPAEAYLADHKLRIMLLRLRPDLPALVRDPMLPHRAAESAKRGAERAHIAYDFAMDFANPSSMFCSEVASAAYGAHGVRLWEGLSSMSGRGVAHWLAALGVRHFVTHGPSDLEYDPKVVVVAEWRDHDGLLDDHFDNAIIDVMLERADGGLELDHDATQLPLARLAKGYSAILNLWGQAGPVPEGMSATVGLRVARLKERHATMKARLRQAAAEFEADRGYAAPYWQLVRLARVAGRGVLQ